MQLLRSRRFIFGIVTCILGSAGLLVPEPADAEDALFRIQRRYHGSPFPAVGESTPPQEAPWTVGGRAIDALDPYKGWTKARTEDGVTRNRDRITYATMLEKPGKAIIEYGNPVGGAFTVPTGWMHTQFTATAFPSTAWTGYLTQTFANYVNLEGRFVQDNPYGVTGTASETHTWLKQYPLISTTDGGKKVYTTTHGGNLGFSRNGKMTVKPGPRNFGGTMRFLNSGIDGDPPHWWYQYKSVGAPLFFKGYFTSEGTRMGEPRSTKDNETFLGENNRYGGGVLKLLEETVVTNTVTPTPRFSKTMYRPLRSPTVTSQVHYFETLGPWTTGTVSVTNMTGVTSFYGAQVRGVGGDYKPATSTNTSVGGIDVLITRTETDIEYKGKYGTYYITEKYYSTLKGVTRVVSLVRPRMVHSYIIPRLATDPIYSNWQANRVWVMDVYFLPEPGALLMLGSGIAGLAGLAFFRRR